VSDGAPVTLPGPAGGLEGRLHAAAGAARALAVVAHPQPLMGGTFANPVVVRVARALAEAGVAALRFNFRGVGASGGAHTGGAEEPRDVGAALGWMAAREPGRPLLAVGYSFGALMTARLAPAHPAVTALVLIGVPLTMGDPIPDCGDRPLLVVQGERDRFGDGAAVAAAVAASGSRRARVHVVPGAEHLFPRQSQAVADAIVGQLDWLLGGGGAQG
jgi:alpha/beta superfamily hydrolase